MDGARRFLVWVFIAVALLSRFDYAWDFSGGKARVRSGDMILYLNKYGVFLNSGP